MDQNENRAYSVPLQNCGLLSVTSYLRYKKKIEQKKTDRAGI